MEKCLYSSAKVYCLSSKSKYDGSRYYIRTLGSIPFYAGMPVPEPYDTIYFGGE